MIRGLGDLDPITQQVATMLEKLGVFFPGPPDPGLDKRFPDDLTSLGLLELGEHHSYFISQHARLTAVHGVVVAQKRSLKHQMTELRQLPLKTPSPAVAQKMRELGDQLVRVEAADAILAGQVDAQKRYVEGCSRELSRRQIEAQLSR